MIAGSASLDPQPAAARDRRSPWASRWCCSCSAFNLLFARRLDAERDRSGPRPGGGGALGARHVRRAGRGRRGAGRRAPATPGLGVRRRTRRSRRRGRLRPWTPRRRVSLRRRHRDRERAGDDVRLVRRARSPRRPPIGYGGRRRLARALRAGAAHRADRLDRPLGRRPGRSSRWSTRWILARALRPVSTMTASARAGASATSTGASASARRTTS